MLTYKDLFSVNENSLTIKNLKTGQARELTLNQFRLLECLMMEKGKKSEIIEYVWLVNNIVVSDGSYHQLVFQMRAIFEAIGLPGEMIKTFPRYGLRLVDELSEYIPSKNDNMITDPQHARKNPTTLTTDLMPVVELVESAKNELLPDAHESSEIETSDQMLPAAHLVEQVSKEKSGEVTKYLGYSFKRKSTAPFICISFFIAGIFLAYCVMSSSLGFLVFTYFSHPPLVYSDKTTRVYSSSMRYDDVKQGVELINAYKEKKTSASNVNLPSIGIMDDFYVYKSLIRCAPGNVQHPVLSFFSGASCENYIVAY